MEQRYEKRNEVGNTTLFFLHKLTNLPTVNIGARQA